jgi:NADH:ubiquinone oxidoreductase subunit 4 (subunit M)
MLRAYRAVFFGAADQAALAWTDPVRSLRTPVILLLAALLFAGFFPNYFLSYLKPTIEALLR